MSTSSPTRTALTAIWAALHTTQYGLAITGLNGIQDAVTCSIPTFKEPVQQGWLKPCIGMTPTQFGLVVSIFTLGGLVGSLSSNAITRPLGRINTLRASATAIMCGSAIVGLANHLSLMIIGRILIGLGCGLATVTVPLFLAEIAPESIKKSLGIMNQLFIVFGMLTGQSLSFPFSREHRWRYVFAVAVIIGAVQLLGSFFVREEEKTKGSRGAGDGEDEPLLGEEVEPMSITDLLTTTDSKIRRAFLVVLVTQISQQTCGISPVMYFSTRILKPVFNGNSRLIALFIVMAKIPLTILPAFLIDRAGSRPLLLGPTAVMSIAAVALAIGINTSTAAVSATAIVLFVMSFSMGLGPVTWVVLSEVMPKEARTASGSVGLAVNWSTNFVMGAMFLPLQEAMSGGKASGEGNIFYLFAGTCVASFLFIRAAYALLARVD